VPLTEFQLNLARLLAVNRSPESHLAGGAALNLEPNSHRFSNDLDYFHDSEERVAESFAKDRTLLLRSGYQVEMAMNQPGFIRAIVSLGPNSTKVEWAHDSAWRFMPPIEVPNVGYVLHWVDLAVNKLLALVGRDEARDFLDILEIDENQMSLGALCWAAAGKDPGFTPLSLLEILRRRGKYRQEDFDRLGLTKSVDLQKLKQRWLVCLKDAEDFIRSRPPDEIGCLYYSPSMKKFVAPLSTQPATVDARPHFGRPGGVIPELKS
jgi:hypothetical protein